MAWLRHLGASAIAVLVACNSGAQLSELRDRVLQIYVRAGDNNAWIFLFFDPSEGECVSVDEDGIVGMFGGNPLTFLGVAQTEFADPPQCYLQFETDGAVTPEDGVVRIRDDSLEVVGSFDVAALEQRVASHETWIFQRQQPSAVKWSHPTDFADPSPSYPPAAITFHTDSEPEVFAAFVAPDLVTFQLPVNFPTGDFVVSVIAQTMVVYQAFDCRNAQTCTSRPSLEYSHATQVIP